MSGGLSAGLRCRRADIASGIGARGGKSGKESVNTKLLGNIIPIVVDDRTIEIQPGTILLQACLDNGIYIPHLCHLEGVDRPAASCRLCFVEIEGQDQPVTACTVRIELPMSVKTDTKVVRQLQRSALNLLLSVHKVTCKTCPANQKCALQNIARFLKVGLKARGVPLQLKTQDCVDTHPVIDYWPNRCVLCGQCIHACRTANDQPLMTFAGRGFDTIISFYASPHISSTDYPCNDCTACIEVCPVGALTHK